MKTTTVFCFANNAPNEILDPFSAYRGREAAWTSWAGVGWTYSTPEFSSGVGWKGEEAEGDAWACRCPKKWVWICGCGWLGCCCCPCCGASAFVPRSCFAPTGKERGSETDVGHVPVEHMVPSPEPASDPLVFPLELDAALTCFVRCCWVVNGGAGNVLPRPKRSPEVLNGSSSDCALALAFPLDLDASFSPCSFASLSLSSLSFSSLSLVLSNSGSECTSCVCPLINGDTLLFFSIPCEVFALPFPSTVNDPDATNEFDAVKPLDEFGGGLGAGLGEVNTPSSSTENDCPGEGDGVDILTLTMEVLEMECEEGTIIIVAVVRWMLVVVVGAFA